MAGPPVNVAGLLDFRAPERYYTMEELDVIHPQALSPFAVSDPFQLLSAECVKGMREELRSQAVQKNCKFSNARTPCTLRGLSRHCPLIKAVWSSQVVTDIVSEIAGLPLKPVMDYELGVCNVQVPDTRGDDESVLVDDWHKDSYPYVAIVMLSDPGPGLGGETAIQRGDGTVLPIAFPTAGSCVVLQGQHVTHCGRRVLGAAAERITMVTSYVPADPCLPDRSVLRGPRPVSNCAQLYHDWVQYRLAAIAQQAQARAAQLQKAPGQEIAPTHMKEVKQWLTDMAEYLKATAQELQ